MAVELRLGALIVLATRLDPARFEAGCNLILEPLKYLIAWCPVVAALTGYDAGSLRPSQPAICVSFRP